MRTAIIVILLFSIFTSSQQNVLKEEWVIHNGNGASSLTFLDLDNDEKPEVYAVSINPTRSYLTVYTYNGVEKDVMVLPTPLDAQYFTAKERVKQVFPYDIDNDGNLDIFSATEIKGGAINTHITYRLQSEPEPGLDKNYVRMKWFDDTMGYVNKFVIDKNNKTNLIFSASIDARIGIYDPDGNKLFDHHLNTSVWDITPLNDTHPEYDYIAGMSRMICRIQDGVPIWCKPTNDRYGFVNKIKISEGTDYQIFAASEHELISLSSNGSILWNEPIPYINGLCIAKLEEAKTINIIVASNNNLEAYNPEGEKQWSHSIGERIISLVPNCERYRDFSKVLLGTRENIYLFSIIEDYAIRDSAEKILKEANQLVEQRQFKQALNKSEISLTLFKKIRDSEKISQTASISTLSREMISAKEMMVSANDHCKDNNYTECIQYANKSLIIFERHGFNDFISTAEELILSSQKTASADKFYEIASDQYVLGEYTQAMENAKKSKQSYQLANQIIGVKKSESLLNMISEKSGKPIEEFSLPDTTPTTTISATSTKENLLTYGALLLSLIFIVGAASTLFNKKQE